MSFDILPNAADSAIDTTNVAAGPELTSSFDTLGLAPEIVRSIGHAGYPSPTEVQLRTVPQALAGHDLMVSSQTGSGKTAAFVWPALQRILDARNDPAKRRPKGQSFGPRVLVLAPTRELAMQVSRAFTVYGNSVQGLRVAHVVGGVPYHAQLKALRGPLDVLICTPGRLLDLMGSGSAIVSQVELLILDEADRMLDMGFIDDITTIAQALPEQRQTMMFSATFAGNVGVLARQLTREPQRISVDSHTDTHASIEQRLHWADSLHHKHALLEQLLADRDVDQAVVFTSTQRDADDLAYKLGEIGHSVAALHGGMPQGRRNRVLQDLRQRHLRVLVATDVAARGIDVPTITHVINYGLPMKAEDYVHRIGRTGRAGRAGLAITLAERRDVGMIRRIERFTTQPITTAVVVGLEPKLPEPSATRPAFSPRGGKPGFGGGRGGYGNNGGFGGGRPDQGAPRNYGGGGGFRGRDDNQGAPRDNGYQGGGGFRDGNQGGGFRDDNRAAAPRGPFDRSGPRTGAGAGPNDRGPRPAGPRGFAGKPAFGPRRTPR
jgi:superfamily II DNA/RNA helicase